jgi:hypothetical protein
MSTPWFAVVHVTDVGRVDAQLPQAVHLDHVPTAPFAFHSPRVTRDPLDVEETHGTDGIHLRLPGRRRAGSGPCRPSPAPPRQTRSRPGIGPQLPLPG